MSTILLSFFLRLQRYENENQFQKEKRVDYAEKKKKSMSNYEQLSNFFITDMHFEKKYETLVKTLITWP